MSTDEVMKIEKNLEKSNSNEILNLNAVRAAGTEEVIKDKNRNR